MKTIRVVGVLAGLFIAATAAACARRADDTRPIASTAPPASGPRRVAIAVTAEGFVPARVKVKAGQPLTLVVTRRVERTCATELVIKDHDVNQPLPLNVPVQVTITPRPGTARFACAMDMVAGELLAE